MSTELASRKCAGLQVCLPGGTIEERIDEIIERKLELAENIVGSGESWLTKLTSAEFKQLMALREEAIGDW